MNEGRCEKGNRGGWLLFDGDDETEVPMAEGWLEMEDRRIVGGRR